MLAKHSNKQSDSGNKWFFEQRDGNCQLIGSFAVRLSETASTWAQALALGAEQVARMFSSTIQATTSSDHADAEQSTRSKKQSPVAPILPQHPESFCRECGVGDRSWANSLRCVRQRSDYRRAGQGGRAGTYRRAKRSGTRA